MWYFFLSLIGSFILAWPTAAGLRRAGVIDRPNVRSSHTLPTVRGGGVAIIMTILSGLGWLFRSDSMRGADVAVLGGGVLLLAVVSFIDDLRSVGPAVRFGCHGAVAAGFLWTVGLPPGVETWGVLGVVAVAAVGFLWIAGYTNAFNFMDGINGLATGQAVVTGLGTAGLGLAAGLGVGHPVVVGGFLVAGAAAGFAPHNFPKARMFMGDVGSAPLGCLLAALGWWLATEAGWVWLASVGLLHANFVLDTGVTLVRRMLRGERWYEAHREHFYQRLVRSGRSHAFVTGWEMAGQALVVALVLGAAKWGNPIVWGMVAIMVVCGWLAWFVYAERCFQRFMGRECASV